MYSGTNQEDDRLNIRTQITLAHDQEAQRLSLKFKI